MLKVKLFKLCAIANVLCLILIILYASVCLPTFSMWFYRWQYKLHDTANLIGVSNTDLEMLTRNLMRYILGFDDNLQINVSVSGTVRPFFSDVEISHMKDVKSLFMGAFFVVCASLAIFLMTLVLCVIKGREHKKILYKTYIIASILTICIFTFLALWSIIDFESIFILFHKMFFNNQDWLLDPSTDFLIVMYPIEFFVTIAVFIFVLFTVFLTVVIFIALFLLKKYKKSKLIYSKMSDNQKIN
ncbi:MAG: TIGR01906 family membrane protein [Clostridiales bacterium]|jgi:integral membrane protein (TIGR01906 family)|nr:TIGR01906 family membrane protein [Clostridiales bacterium]